ncbi:MAG: hypothetical protein RL119_1518 [Actinomycetota bacterium]
MSSEVSDAKGPEPNAGSSCTVSPATRTPIRGQMVKRMSVHTQFVFISHNKIAMEMAQQLIGVTMQEQGVSRIVEVDMEEALRLADNKEAA